MNNCKLTNLDYTDCMYFVNGGYSCKVDQPKPAEQKQSIFGMEAFTSNQSPSVAPSQAPSFSPYSASPYRATIKMHK